MVSPRWFLRKSLMALFGPPSNGLVVFATGWVVWVLSQVKSSLVVSSVAKSLCARLVWMWVYHHFWCGLAWVGRGVFFSA